ncbi:MAG: hypothetical protein PF549_01375 [Patescibacteria group bacterium]|nr:hypothetical protein [Patescibacteria group bacterium]
MILPALVGFIAVVVNLVLTLNLVSSLVIGALVIVMMFFYKSFSRGWLILLGVALLFPSTRIGGGEVFLFDLFLIILIVVSLFQLALKDKKITSNRLAFSFFLLILIGFVMIVCGSIFGIEINEKVWRILLSTITFWFLLSAFQYFFQTKRRIKRFFTILVSTGTLHSIFGIFTFIFGTPTSSGLGISTVKTQHILFKEISTQVTGLFGTGLEQELGVNPLAGFLLITILITFGFIIVNFQQEKDLLRNIESDKEDDLVDIEDRENEWENQVFGDYIQRDYRKQRIIFICLAIIQLVALFLTFSYSTLLFFVIAVFVLGILLKNKHIIAVAAVMAITFTIIFPGFMASNLSSHNEQWFEGVTEIKKNWFFGNGVEFIDNSHEIARNEIQISNSYIYIWNYYGIFGFLVLISMLLIYFFDIYRNFQKTKKAARVWYIIIFTIFITIVLEGFSGNILIIGPTAVVFWLLYGVVVNLRNKNIEFGLTETNISKD